MRPGSFCDVSSGYRVRRLQASVPAVPTASIASSSMTRLVEDPPWPDPVFGSAFTAGAPPDGALGFDGVTPPPLFVGGLVGTTVTVVTGVAFPGSVATVVGTATASSVIVTAAVSPAVTVTVEAALAYGASLVTVTG
jgi:hypothetical protein